MNNFSLLAGAMPFLAQTPAPQLPDLPRTKSILDTLIAAGPVMYVLLAMSIILVMLLVTYLLTIRRGAVVSSGFMATADALSWMTTTQRGGRKIVEAPERQPVPGG